MRGQGVWQTPLAEIAQFDHLVPNDASRPITDAEASTETETMIFPTGHIGMFVGSRSQGEVCPKIASWLKKRSILESAGKQNKTKKQSGKGVGR